MNIRRVFSFLTLLALVALGIIFVDRRNSYRNITAEDAVRLAKTDTSVIFLDVRTRDEYQGETGHLPGAYLIPFQEIEQRMEELERLKPKRIIMYCQTGRSSANASILLAKRGFSVFNLEGGIVRWQHEGYPVAKGGN